MSQWFHLRTAGRAATCLLAAMLVAAAIGCSDGDARPDSSGVSAQGGSQGEQGGSAGTQERPLRHTAGDKSLAIAVANDARRLESKLRTPDPIEILNLIGWLIGNGGEIPLLSAPSDTSTRNYPLCERNATQANSAACDASGCVFREYSFSDVGAYPHVADGSISVARATAADSSISIDVTLSPCSSSVGPERFTASFEFTQGQLDGWFRATFDIPSFSETFVRFVAVTFTDDGPASGSLYARWASADADTYEATVAFP